MRKVGDTYCLDLFMWDQQPQFRNSSQGLADRVFSRLTPDIVPPTVRLVGVLRAGETDANQVCVEPEDGPWTTTQFDGLQLRAAEIYAKHPGHRGQYLNDGLNVEHRVQIRRHSLKLALLESLVDYDRSAGQVSFCGSPAVVGKFEVCPIISFRAAAFQGLPALLKDNVNNVERRSVVRSLQEATVKEFLNYVSKELSKPNPSSACEFLGKEEESILRKAGRRLMYTVEDAGYKQGWELFETCSEISLIPYEKSEGKGRMIIAKPTHPAIEYTVRLKNPVPLDESRWARKVLQMASGGVSILSDSKVIYGLGRLSDKYNPADEDIFIITFKRRGEWELAHGELKLMTASHGVPSLPRGRLDSEMFKSNLRRVLPRVTVEAATKIWATVDAAVKAAHGTMVVVSDDATGEASRLQRQGTPVEPTELVEEEVRQVSAIDGAILLDTAGKCHAIGVILDGLATAEGKASRGARYNSAVRYLAGAKNSTLAVVISDDGSVEVLPTLRPQLKKKDVQSIIENARSNKDLQSFFGVKAIVESLCIHRFYFNQAQCEEINSLIKGFSEHISMFVKIVPFEVSPEMNDSFLISDDE